MHHNQATESGSAAEMPRYKCHKEVWALKIKAIEYDRAPLEGEPRGNARITPVEAGYAPFVVDEKWAMKNRPQVGGYYVVYADGYASYSPAPAFEEGYARLTGNADKSVLDIVFESCDLGENLTVREYLRRLLDTLWVEGEAFSGKRPFGNSGWDWDLYAGLVKGGKLAGTLDEDGNLEDCDGAAGEKLVRELIKAMCQGC